MGIPQARWMIYFMQNPIEILTTYPQILVWNDEIRTLSAFLAFTVKLKHLQR